MPSQLQDTPVDQLDWDNLTSEQLADLRDNDERTTVQEKAGKLYDERTAPPPVLGLDEYDPRQDPGPARIEDLAAAAEDDTPVDSTEVPLEDSVKDHTTVLATDTFDLEGNLTNRERPAAPDYAAQE